LRDKLNFRSTFRFNARITPIRANMVAAERRDEDQGFHRRLPLRSRVLRFRQLGDVGAGVLQRDELAPARQRYRIIERPVPAAIRRTVEAER
jgi:hypothetical protein